MTPNEQKAYEKLVDEMQRELFKVASNDTNQNFNDRLNNQRTVLEKYILLARADERRRIGEEIQKVIEGTNWIEQPRSAYGKLEALIHKK